MIQLTFTEEQIEQLSYERFHHPHPRVQKKMEAVLLKAKGFKHKQICDVLGICGNTLRSYLREFAEGGLDRLRRFDAGGSINELDEYTDVICDHLAEHPPHTIAEAAKKIEQLTGIRRGQTQVREFLRRAGFRRLKTGSLPAKADPEEQERFKKTNLSLV
jgi:transposase